MKIGSERRRRRVVVEKDFQYRFTLKMCLIGGGLLVAYGGLVLYMIRISYEALRDNAVLLMPDMLSSLDREQRLLSLSLVAVLVLLVAFLFGLGLFLTQRIAGPMLQLQKRLIDFGDGRRGLRIRFRKDDEFHVIATAFNTAMENFESNHDETWSKIGEISRELGSGNAALQKRLEEIIEKQKAPFTARGLARTPSGN